MKLTKGRINKLLKTHRHTVKHMKPNTVINRATNRNNFTIRSSKRPLNLANKTLHRCITNKANI